MSDRIALITDLDGTIYDWADFFVPSFRLMIESLVNSTGLDEDTIIEAFRRVYLKHKTVEYPFDIEELDIWSSIGWSTEEIHERGVRPAQEAFEVARVKNLHLYPHVMETLQWAKE